MVNDETADLVDVFSLNGKVRLIGSNSLRAIQYGSDYDIETELKGTTGEKVAKALQKRQGLAKDLTGLKEDFHWMPRFW